MLRQCRFCNTEFEARGKRLYCSDKCKKNYENALRGKPKPPKLNYIPENINDSSVHTVLGQLTKVSTTADQCVRFQIDVPLDQVKIDTVQFLHQTVIVGFVPIEQDNGAPEEKTGKERFF